MASWRTILTERAVDVENEYDMLKYRLRERLGHRDPIMILPYRGYGTSERLYLHGRVLENRDISGADSDDTVWDNLLDMYKRFKSNEIPYARVRARFGAAEQVVTADDDGFFDVWIEPSRPLPPGPAWREVELELVEPQRNGAEPVRATGRVLVAPPSAEFVVISDIDDTVVHTDAANLSKMARTVFLGNAALRLPFEGVSAFYRALEGGSTGQAGNPLFYLSNSPWNMYDLFCDFLDLHGIPTGPVFLRNWGLSNEGVAPFNTRRHKLAYVRKILDTFHDLPFVLIGDSGERDPEIYQETVALYPNRIRAVYIRNVSRRLQRADEIKALAEQVLAAGSTLLMAENTVPLAEHAAAQGWNHWGAVPAVEAAQQADQAPPSPIEKLLGVTEKEAPETVVVPGADAPETVQAVEGGAIEEALKQGDSKKEETPTVLVDPTEQPPEEEKKA